MKNESYIIFRAEEIYKGVIFSSKWSESLEDAKSYKPINKSKTKIVCACCHLTKDGHWLPTNSFVLKF